ncbi:unnamed protein product [Mytilus coruscus]|uniref:Cadherin domain-containing protein n=1 Tax=Mytilus coruscus TaxID=42192 RepID=A0A6J8B078_MYTCO|nr:unnamed protein product [Mytilus coruscus]
MEFNELIQSVGRAYSSAVKDDYPIKLPSCETIKLLVVAVLKNNYFEFNDRYFVQKICASMGSKCSPEICDIRAFEPPTINGLPRASDIREDVVVETTLYTFSVTDPESTVVTCDVTAIIPSTNIMFIKPSPNFNEFDILLQSNPSLIYDVVRTYRLDIQCSDGRRTDTNVFFMNVLRNKPTVFLNLQNITTVSSVASYIGQIVFDVDISDPENDQVQFSMFCVPSTNCPLEIYHSGEIVLKRSIEGEFVPVYDVYVHVTDGRSTTGPRSLTVHVVDINYVPVIRNLPLPSALVVSENSALGLSIFQVSIQDNDGSDTHTYSMTSFPSDGVLYFDIDSATGLMSVSATTNVNYEAVSSTSFTLTITVSDTKDSASQNLTVTIANQNEAPVFKKTSPGDYHDRDPERSEINQRNDRQANGYSYPSWNAWKWYEQQ